MNLNSVNYDNVLAIDQRLQMLEQQVTLIDQQYGYSQLPPPQFEIAMPSTQAPLPHSKEEVPPQH